jgi:histidine ammonia-lyase
VSAKKLAQVTENVANALAIELLVGCAGIDQRAPLRPSRGVEAAHREVRRRIPALTEDRPLYLDFATVRGMLRSGEVLSAVEQVVGSLG